MEFAAGGVEGTLFFLRAVVNERAAVLVDRVAEKPLRSNLSQRRVFVQVADDFSAQPPEVVHVPTKGLRGKTRGGQLLDEGSEASQQLLAGRQVFFQLHP